MNAYELANELEDVDAKNYREIAANMLRQQADKIKSLEQELFVLHNAYSNRVLRTYDGKLND